MQMAELQARVRSCIGDATLTYRQRVQRLAALAENALEPPPVSAECELAQAKGVVHDLGEGNAPHRPRYVLPDYARALAQGSKHLELASPRDLDEALAFLLAMYPSVPSITGYPVYLGDLDTLLEPFTAGLGDDELTRRLRLFWRTVDRQLPDAFVHADLGPRDGRVVRAILQVDRELRQVVPNLTLRVDPQITPDDLVRAAVRTACADGKPHFVNHPMMVADLGPRYGVVSCYDALPLGGGAHTLVRLNLAESVRRAEGGSREYLSTALARDVALTAELIASRVRFLVEEARFYEHDWLVCEGLVRPDRFTAMFGVFGVAEAVNDLLARDGVVGADGGPASYGRDQAASDVAQTVLAEVARLVARTPIPHCEATGGHALLHAQSGIDTDVDVTAGARVPPGREPALYEHIRMVAPNHRYFPAGVSDVFRFEPAVEANPDAVVAVLRGAFEEGMRDFTFDVTGNGFTRVTGYLVRDRDVAALRQAAAAHVAAIRRAAPTEKEAVRAAGRVVKGVPAADADG
ncbi:MAG TPA: YjjI family glycine radical enzyme [Kineosporiaceae bacterium]